MNPVCILVKYNSLVKKKEKCVSLSFYKYGENVAKEIQYFIKPYSRFNFQKYMNFHELRSPPALSGVWRVSHSVALHSDTRQC